MVEERSETEREERRRAGEPSESHIDEDTRSRGERTGERAEQDAGDFTELRERGDRKGGSTSGN